MKIKQHSLPITSLARLMSTDTEDLVAWIEEFLREDFLDDYETENFYTLDEVLDNDDFSRLADMIIGHYLKENIVTNAEVTHLLKQIRL